MFTSSLSFMRRATSHPIGVKQTVACIPSQLAESRLPRFPQRHYNRLSAINVSDPSLIEWQS